MAGSLESLRGGLENHEGELAELCEDVGRRADQASKEMLDFKDKVCVYARYSIVCTCIVYTNLFRVTRNGKGRGELLLKQTS